MKDTDTDTEASQYQQPAEPLHYNKTIEEFIEELKQEDIENWEINKEETYFRHLTKDIRVRRVVNPASSFFRHNAELYISKRWFSFKGDAELESQLRWLFDGLLSKYHNLIARKERERAQKLISNIEKSK